MPNKKNIDATPPEEQELERRVDAMMDPARPEAPAADPTPPKEHEASKPGSPPPIDIFAAVGMPPATAPEVPEKPGKEAAAEKTAKVVSEKAEPVAAKSAAAADTPPAAEPEPAAEAEIPSKTALDDPATDAAVDDIMAKEGDELLAVQDAATTATTVPKSSKPARFKRFRPTKRFWILLLPVVLLILFAVPLTRYKLVGLVLKKSVTVTIVDSKTKTPVSAATVQLAGKTAKTDAAGKASLRVPVGATKLVVSKQYYHDGTRTVFIGLSGNRLYELSLQATGRQVPITVVNKITGKPLAGVDIKVLNTSAKTDKNGRATIVLPTSASSDKVSLSAGSYNGLTAVVIVTSNVVAANTFALTPSGHVYFLSNASGTIDVVKTNLDGSDRQTVIAGTGKEDPNNTLLLASRDWRYLALESQRSGGQAALYLIDTATDKLTEFDSGNSTFALVGWHDHAFIYDTVRNSLAVTQAGREIIKSYDAERGQLNQLDQNQVDGSGTAYAYQSFYNFYLTSNLVTYNTQWSANGGFDLSSKNDTIRGVQPDGQTKKDYLTLPASGLSYLQAVLYRPQEIYYSAYNYNDNKTTYYSFNGTAATQSDDVDQGSFNQAYPTYLISPSGKQTLWSDLRDGQNRLFVGDQNAQSQTQLSAPTGYKAYGWYSDSYILVSKDGSELYIMPASGSQSPQKLTDYYKPAQPLFGYGYGYGGL